jgi:serine/threonine-protein kinase HipA
VTIRLAKLIGIEVPLHGVELSPAYDLLNSTIILNSQEELALSLNGKKNRLKKNDLFEYLAKKRLGLN